MSDNINELLNKVLADYQIYYQKLRNYHWNVKGKNFFGLHAKFEELYTEAAEHIDVIAERILMRGGKPLSNLQNYIDAGLLKEEQGNPDAELMVKTIVGDLNILCSALRSVAEAADSAEDASTENVLEDMVLGHEKTLWMFKSFLAE